MTLELIRKTEAARRIGLSQGHMMRLARSGAFPSPVRISSNSVGFVADEVTNWIEKRIAERDARADATIEDNPAARADGREAG